MSGAALYKMSPDGLTLDRALDFYPTGISDDGGLVAWGGGSIYIEDEDATYTLPQTILKAFGDPTGAVLFMDGGEVWRRNNDPDFPGWDTLSTVLAAVYMIRADGGWIALGNGDDLPGIGLSVSQDLLTWTSLSEYCSGTRLTTFGAKVVTYSPPKNWIVWFDTSGWHLAGNLKARILDISA